MSRPMTTRRTGSDLAAWYRDRWALLAALEVNRESIVAVHGLQDCLEECGPNCLKGKTAHPFLGFRHWPGCPLELLRGRHWQGIVRLYNASKTSQLSDWPMSYPAFRVDGLNALRTAFARKAAETKPGKPAGGGLGPGASLPYPGRAHYRR